MMKRVPAWVIGAGAAGMAVAAAISTTLEVKVVPAPTPIITFAPTAPSVKDDAPKGTVVATVIITMDNGSPVPGWATAAITAQTPSDIFTLAKIDAAHYQIVVDPSGPGLNKGPATNVATVRATTTSTP